MIGHISGVLKDKTSNEVLVEAGGVGYEISLTMPAWFEIGELGDQVSVWCHLVVREDVQQLFGFRDKDERLMFRELIRISGIGPKVAQAILSAMDLPQLFAAIRDDQVAVLVKIPGIGKKTAERLVIELKDRLGQLDFGAVLEGQAPAVDAPMANQQQEEALQALTTLGYKSADAKRMLQLVSSDCDSVEDMVRAALRSQV
ncbi:MAG: Holliday junction branch migration protein RuvA [Porticoccaceae bacterium]|nr:Holliday junction branch migration protein RuvA [Porticoccaceae bacterium]